MLYSDCYKNHSITAYLECKGFKKYLIQVRITPEPFIRYVFNFGNGNGLVVGKDASCIENGDKWYVTPCMVISRGTDYRIKPILRYHPFVMKDKQVRKLMRHICHQGISYNNLCEIELMQDDTPSRRLNEYYKKTAGWDYIKYPDWPVVGKGETRVIK